MVDGNRVCVGSSRIGTGCFDQMGTGMCASKSEIDCEEACRDNPRCELFVFYPEEKKGSCVLCSDLFSAERTVNEATRAYTVGAARVPPMPPGMTRTSDKYAIVPEPSPPPPPAKPRPPPPVSHLGRHKNDKSHSHVDCSFVEGVEFTSSKQEGYSDRIAASKEECCQLCGHLESGCANFVYEAGSGVCVLLPLTPSSQIERDDNEYVVSGTASVGAVAAGASAFPSSSCSFTPNSGYSTGRMGPAPRLPGGEMETREECCQACGVTSGCTRFTFSESSKACTMYKEFAQLVIVDDMTSGSIPSKLIGATGASGGGFTSGPASFDVALDMPPAPALPSFAILEMMPPPPPPDRSATGDSMGLKSLISDVSIVAGSAFVLGLLMCIYCFFSPNLIALVQRIRDGKPSRKNARRRDGYAPARRKPRRGLDPDDDDDDDYDDDDDDEYDQENFPRGPPRGRRALERAAPIAVVAVADERRGRKGRGGRPGSARRGERGGRFDDEYDEPPEPEVELGRRARLVVQTTAICQTRDSDVGRCESMDDLRTLFFDEFPSVLKGLRPKHMQLFCLAPSPARGELAYVADEDRMWLLVTRESDFTRVMECPAFRLQDERCDEAIGAEYVVAFAEARRGRRGRRKQERAPQPLQLGYNPNVVGLDRYAASEVGMSSYDRQSERGSVRSYRSSRSHSSRAARDRSRESARIPRERSRESARPPRDRSRESMRSYRSSRSRTGYASAPASVVGRPLADEPAGGSSSGEESATSGRRLLRGTGRTKSEKAYAESARPPSPPGTAPQLVSLEHLSARLQHEVLKEQHGVGTSRRGSRAPSVAPSAHSAWEDDDDSTRTTGRCSGKVRGGGMGDLE